VFSAAYLARPLGGLVLANFGDVFGRRYIFLFSIGLMTFATLGVAFLPTYDAIGITAPVLLILLRCLQGIAIGGEIPGGWTFIFEHMPANRRGLACGLLCSGLSFGILLGCGTALLFQAKVDPQWLDDGGWRYPFIFGGILGLVAVAARRSLRETPVFRETRISAPLVPLLPLEVIFRDLRTKVLVCTVLTWLLSASLVITTMLNVHYLHIYVGYSTYDSLLATACGVMALTLATWPIGILVDRYGPGPVIMVGSVALAAAAMLYYGYSAVSPAHLFWLNSLLGACVGVCGAIPYAMVSAFPPQVRYTGVSLCYNFSAVMGGLTPLCLNWFMQFEPMSYAYYLAALSSLAFAAGLHLWLNEMEPQAPLAGK
jgi:MFS family permease